MVLPVGQSVLSGRGIRDRGSGAIPANVPTRVQTRVGANPISQSATFFKRTIHEWAALWLPFRWPHGIKTRPEMDQHQDGAPRPSLPPIWRSSAFFSVASAIRRASSLLTRRSVRCRGPSACATPIFTWTIICGSSESRLTYVRSDTQVTSNPTYQELEGAANI
jgi:hypothetical protein